MKSFFSNVWSLAVPYFKSGEKKMAYLLLATIIGLNLGEVYINVLLNKWNNDFYNSLQEVNKTAFTAALIKFSYLAFSYILVVVYKVYINQLLQIRWRRWLTGHFIGRWMHNQNYYRMQLAGNPSDNPDQRISEDTGQFIDLTLSLTLGLMSSIVTLFSFLFILWNLSGPITIPLAGFADSVTIPGYMVWAALVYAVIGTWITNLLGHPLVKLNFNQQKYEADFRFSLVRFRENTERIALYKGEAQEQAGFFERFSRVFDNYWAIMKRQKTLAWFTSGYYQLAIIFPFVVSSPRFFAKEIQLGGLMQISSAFGQVQGSFSYIIAAYNSIATWRAVVDRLAGFTANIREAETTRAFVRQPANDEKLSVKDLSISLPNGRQLLDQLSFSVSKGDAMLINGPSGSGKSTLLRTLAGIWPYAQGSVALPQDKKTLFLPQMPYLPLGSLREVLSYPAAPVSDDNVLTSLLSLVNLDRLKDKLNTVDNWSHILSPGEQQRIAIARTMLQKPDFVFLDEATSALDEASEATLYKALREKLPQAAIVSVGHRSTLKEWHNKMLELKPTI